MSGHSHAKTIKHQKNITDQKRGQMFSKMARVISVAVKEGGPNPETNTKLRAAVEEAKKINMPKENVERAIKQATGGAEGTNLEEVVFEAYGPEGTAVIIEGITDNKNRTLGEIKQTLSQNSGKLAGEGSVRWMFERKGCITISSQFPISDYPFLIPACPTPARARPYRPAANRHPSATPATAPPGDPHPARCARRHTDPAARRSARRA